MRQCRGDGSTKNAVISGLIKPFRFSLMAQFLSPSTKMKLAYYTGRPVSFYYSACVVTGPEELNSSSEGSSVSAY